MVLKLTFLFLSKGKIKIAEFTISADYIQCSFHKELKYFNSNRGESTVKLKTIDLHRLLISFHRVGYGGL